MKVKESLKYTTIEQFSDDDENFEIIELRCGAYSMFPKPKNWKLRDTLQNIENVNKKPLKEA